MKRKIPLTDRLCQTFVYSETRIKSYSKNRKKYIQKISRLCGLITGCCSETFGSRLQSQPSILAHDIAYAKSHHNFKHLSHFLLFNKYMSKESCKYNMPLSLHFLEANQAEGCDGLLNII